MPRYRRKGDGSGARPAGDGDGEREPRDERDAQPAAWHDVRKSIRRRLGKAMHDLDASRTSDDDTVSTASVGSTDGSDTTAQRVKRRHAEASEAAVTAWRARVAAEVEGALRTAAEEVNAALAQCTQSVKDALDSEIDRARGVTASDSAPLTNDVEVATARRRRLWTEREFVRRSSVLSDMLQDPSIMSIYHIFLSILVWLFFSLVVEDLFSDTAVFDATLLSRSFDKFDVVMYVWALVFCTSFSAIVIVRVVAYRRLPLRTWLPLYGSIQLGLLLFSARVCFVESLPPASALVVMCESVRMCLKMHSYVREKLVHGVPANAGIVSFIPQFAIDAGVTPDDVYRPHITIAGVQTEIGRFIFFMFAPTLVYRDRYPRSGRHVRWLVAGTHLFNVVASIFFTSLVFMTFMIPQFVTTARDPGDARAFVASVFRSMLPGVLTLVLLFFGVLHSWFNMWAEVLRYGDRRFYDDWWTACDWGTFYRKWNAVVHEWLYVYIYQDAIRFSRVSRGAATLLVFVVSAVLHEIVLSCSLRMVYPVLLLMFGGPGVIFVRLTRNAVRANNVFMWLMLCVGTGLMMVLYSREWYARFGDIGPDLSAAYDALPWWTAGIPRSWLAFYVTVPPSTG